MGGGGQNVGGSRTGTDVASSDLKDAEALGVESGSRFGSDGPSVLISSVGRGSFTALNLGSGKKAVG